jgi:cell division protein FtsB
MSDKITENELKLADRVNELSDAAARPVVMGGGLFAQAANFLMRRVSRGIMTTALIVFIAYHGFEAFNGAIQAMADLQQKRAEVGTATAEAKALNAKIAGDSVALATMKNEIDKLEQQAAEVQAKADADNTFMGDATIKLQSIRAEIDKTKAEAKSAKTEADAQLQMIDGLSVAVQQKKAEVETLEEKAKAVLAGMAQQVEIHRTYIERNTGLCSGGFC